MIIVLSGNDLSSCDCIGIKRLLNTNLFTSVRQTIPYNLCWSSSWDFFNLSNKHREIRSIETDLRRRNAVVLDVWGHMLVMRKCWCQIRVVRMRKVHTNTAVLSPDRLRTHRTWLGLRRNPVPLWGVAGCRSRRILLLQQRLHTDCQTKLSLWNPL